MSATTQVTVSRTGRQHRTADDVATTDFDPRPGAVRAEWSWCPGTTLRDVTTFWSLR